MQFLQKQKNKSEFVVVDNSESATHIFTENGELHLLTKSKESFEDNETVPEPLGLPVLNFEENEEKEQISNVNNGTPKGLPLPVLNF